MPLTSALATLDGKLAGSISPQAAIAAAAAAPVEGSSCRMAASPFAAACEALAPLAVAVLGVVPVTGLP